MTNSSPQIGRIGLIQINGATVGYFQGYTAKESAKNVKEYCCQSTNPDWPAVAFSGNKDYKIDVDALYVDNSYHVLLETGVPVTVILGPVGSSGGNPKITIPCLISDVSDTVKQEKVTTYKVSLRICRATS